MTRPLARALSILLAAAVVFAQAPQARALTDSDVDKAIAKIKAYLYNNEDAQGTWEGLYKAGHIGEGGATVIATTALLVSRESSQNPKLRKAIEWLRAQQQAVDEKDGKTYLVGLRCHVWGALPDPYLPLMRKDAEWLLAAAQPEATFNYGFDGKGKRYDHSNTQYGILGLWEAAKRGIHVSEGFWKRVEDHFVKAQLPDGGWNYYLGQDKPGYLNMTAAGAAALLVAQQELYPTTPSKRMAEAIEKGVRFLDKHYSGNEQLYGMYGVERVALASGVKYLNHKDWFEAGAASIIRQQSAAGNVGNLPDTAFALMFLWRGRVPVWITKLQIPGYAWNNRPNDLYFLTRYLSDMREGELNWQYVSIDLPVEDLLTTPAAYLSVNAPLDLDDAHKKKIKQYLDLGGMLIVNVEGNNPSAKSGIEDLAKELYPQYAMRALPPEHLLFQSLHQITGPEARGVFGLSNGARELIIVNNRDWGASSFDPGNGERQANPAYKIAANTFALATDLGVLPNRLTAYPLKRIQREGTGQATIGRAKFTNDAKEGNWLPEPGTWEMAGRFIFNHTGLEVKTQDVELANLSASGLHVAHMTGAGPVKLSQSEIDSIVNFARSGGLLLVETVGGHGEFARSVEQQLTPIFKKNAVPIPGDDPLISGKDIPGAFNNSKVNYRRHTIVSISVRNRPRLAAFYEAGRPAVVISTEDLSLGALGVRQWGVLGYEIDSARKILTNFAIKAKQ